VLRAALEPRKATVGVTKPAPSKRPIDEPRSVGLPRSVGGSDVLGRRARCGSHPLECTRRLESVRAKLPRDPGRITACMPRCGAQRSTLAPRTRLGRLGLLGAHETVSFSRSTRVDLSSSTAVRTTLALWSLVSIAFSLRCRTWAQRSRRKVSWPSLSTARAAGIRSGAGGCVRVEVWLKGVILAAAE
jgi:hypothetical protein